MTLAEKVFAGFGALALAGTLVAFLWPRPAQQRKVSLGLLGAGCLLLLIAILLPSPPGPEPTPSPAPSSPGPSVPASSTVSPTPLGSEPPIITATSSPEPEPGAQATSSTDGAALVYIPGATFKMGNSEMTNEEYPEHDIAVEAFWMDLAEVTNSLYGLCVKDGPCKSHIADILADGRAYYGEVPFADYPVINVTWFAARSYCEWAGRRLPTEEEWELAARGTDGRTYPWEGEVKGSSLADFVYSNQADRIPSKVGSYPDGASPYGVLDMAGNVAEWTDSWFDAYPDSPYSNPSYGTTRRVARGGSYASYATQIRTSYRTGLDPNGTSQATGFRCAISAEDLGP